ncbi:hypothetical protein APHAL10511_002876 [Amanita phalloides]|nr:hypothetical protein APHAL10511_002876 [Amanita phalloides]
MPFFEGAHDFVIKSAEMNDVQGDYNRNVTHTTYNNRDVGNNYTSSVVNRGNTENQNFTIGGGSNNVVSVHGRRHVNGNASVQPAELQSLLQSLLSELPSAQATQTSVAGSAVPRPVGITSPGNAAATPAPAAAPSTMLNVLGNLPADSWTPRMLEAMDTLFQASREIQAGSVSTEGSVVNTDQSQGVQALPHTSLTQQT